MLGAVSNDAVFHLIQALAENDGVAVLEEVERAAELTPDFSAILREALGLLHRIALTQQVPGYLSADDPDHDRIAEIAGRIPAEAIQLYYQILLIGQQDLALAPDPRTGLEMVLLRALAFLPEPLQTAASSSSPGWVQVPQQTLTPNRDKGVASDVSATSRTAPAPRESVVGIALDPAYGVQPDNPTAASSDSLCRPEDWHNLLPRLGLRGISSELAQHCELVTHQDGQVVLNMDPEFQQLRLSSAEQRLESALANALGAPVQLKIRVVHPLQETPALRKARSDAQRQAAAEELMHSDPVAGRLEERFDARIVPGSIRPID